MGDRRGDQAPLVRVEMNDDEEGKVGECPKSRAVHRDPEHRPAIGSAELRRPQR